MLAGCCIPLQRPTPLPTVSHWQCRSLLQFRSTGLTHRVMHTPRCAGELQAALSAATPLP
jgi:hypothetical protein